MSRVDRAGWLLQPGMMDYAIAWNLQRRLAAARAEEHIPDTLILLEHTHTYTLGRSGKIEHLLMNASERARKGVAVYEVDRGGDITYHGPGQLVGYPIMALGRPGQEYRRPQVDYVGYLRRIEEVLINVLTGWNIAASRLRGYTGVWVDAEGPAKVAAIGVKVDGRGISQHGFALNVAPDLSFFDGIVPCGIADREVTSMARLMGRTLEIERVATVVADQFGREFDLHLERVSLAQVEKVLERESEYCLS